MSTSHSSSAGAEVQIAAERELPDSVWEISVEVSPALSEKTHDRAKKEVAKTVSLPGFRKGHVPDPYLQERYGGQIESRWSQLLAEAAIELAISLSSRKPLTRQTQVEYRWETRDVRANSLLIANFECAPKLPDRLDLAALKLEIEKIPSLPPNAIEDILNGEAKRHTTFSEVNRPAEVDDRIDFEIRSRADPQVILSQGCDLPLSSDQIAPWVRELLGQTSGGESRSAEAQLPDQSEPTQCTIDVSRVVTPVVPQIDDALAKQVGFADLKAWREQAREYLTKRLRHEHRARGHRLLLEAIIQAHPFDVPKSSLQRQLQTLKREATSHEGDLPARALHMQRSAMWFAHWSATRGDLLTDQELFARVDQELKALPPPKSEAENLERAQEILRWMRWSLIAERVLDEALAELGWLSEEAATSAV